MSKTNFGGGCFAQLFYSGASYLVFVGWKRARGPLGIESGEIFMIAAVGAVLVLIGMVLAGFHQQGEQEIRDVRAEALLAQLKANQWPLPRFSLFLRPFILDGQILLETFRSSQAPVVPSHYSEPSHESLEVALAKSLEGDSFLVALDAGEARIGASHLRVSDEEWIEAYRGLARSSEKIFVMPAPRRSLLWEIEWLKRRDFIRKCIFIMPPGEADVFGPLWREAREQLLGFHLELPEYIEHGLLFTLGEDGKPRATQIFPIMSGAVGRGVRELLPEVPMRRELSTASEQADLATMPPLPAPIGQDRGPQEQVTLDEGVPI